MHISIPCKTYDHSRQLCLAAADDFAAFAMDVLANDVFYRASFLLAQRGSLDTAAMMERPTLHPNDSDVYAIDLVLHDTLLERIAGIAGIAMAFSEVLKFNELKLIGGRLLDAYRFLYNYRWVQL